MNLTSLTMGLFDISYDGCPQYGYTALILAAESGHKEIIEILCDYGANIEETNKVRKEVDSGR